MLQITTDNSRIIVSKDGVELGIFPKGFFKICPSDRYIRFISVKNKCSYEAKWSEVSINGTIVTPDNYEDLTKPMFPSDGSNYAGTFETEEKLQDVIGEEGDYAFVEDEDGNITVYFWNKTQNKWQVTSGSGGSDVIGENGNAVSVTPSGNSKLVKLNIDANDKVLSQSTNGLLSTLSFTRDPATGRVSLKGKDGVEIGYYIETLDQVLESVEIVTNPEGQPAGTYFKFVFNDADKDPLFLNVNSLIVAYTAGNKAVRIGDDFKIYLVVDANSNLVINDNGLGLKEGYNLITDELLLKLEDLKQVNVVTELSQSTTDAAAIKVVDDLNSKLYGKSILVPTVSGSAANTGVATPDLDNYKIFPENFDELKGIYLKTISAYMTNHPFAFDIVAAKGDRDNITVTRVLANIDSNDYPTRDLVIEINTQLDVDEFPVIASTSYPPTWVGFSVMDAPDDVLGGFYYTTRAGVDGLSANAYAISYDYDKPVFIKGDIPRLDEKIDNLEKSGIFYIDNKYFTPVDLGNGYLEIQNPTWAEIQEYNTRYNSGGYPVAKSSVGDFHVNALSITSGVATFQYEFSIRDNESIHIYTASVSGTEANIISNVTERIQYLSDYKTVVISQSDYDAIAVKDANTLYYIKQ